MSDPTVVASIAPYLVLMQHALTDGLTAAAVALVVKGLGYVSVKLSAEQSAQLESALAKSIDWAISQGGSDIVASASGYLVHRFPGAVRGAGLPGTSRLAPNKPLAISHATDMVMRKLTTMAKPEIVSTQDTAPPAPPPPPKPAVSFSVKPKEEAP